MDIATIIGLLMGSALVIGSIMFGGDLSGRAREGARHDQRLVDRATGTIMGKPAVMAGFWGSHMGLVDLLLERDGTTEVDGYGVRSHWWGIDPPSQIQLGDPATDAPATVVLPAVDGQWFMAVSEHGTVARWMSTGEGATQLRR